MSAVELFSYVLVVVETSVIASRVAKSIYFKARAERTKRETSLLAKNYGRKTAYLISLLSPQTTRQYEIIDTMVLNGGDEEIRVFRQTITDESNMTAVAGAIIAQIAITGLSLPYLSSTHWTARGCLLLATVSGCLAVYYACELQRTIGRLYKPKLVKEWLRLPSLTDQAEVSETGLRASLSAMLILGAPFFMVRVSILSYLLGLAIYEGLLFAKNLDTDTTQTQSRDSFITLMVGTGVFLGFFLFVFATKDIESTLSYFYAIGGSASSVDHNQQSQVVPPEDRQIVVDGLEENGRHLSRRSVDRHKPSAPLTQALQDAAEAHRRCAEADIRVADEYAALIVKDPTPSESDA